VFPDADPPLVDVGNEPKTTFISTPLKVTPVTEELVLGLFTLTIAIGAAVVVVLVVGAAVVVVVVVIGAVVVVVVVVGAAVVVVVVVGACVVVVVVVVGAVVVVVVVVVGACVVVVVVVPVIITSIEFKQTPSDLILIVDAKSGTFEDEYPASKVALLTPFSKGDVKLFIFEYKSNGPVSFPAVVNVINTVIILFLNY
jgi:hypothetical protein